MTEKHTKVLVVFVSVCIFIVNFMILFGSSYLPKDLMGKRVYKPASRATIAEMELNKFNKMLRRY